MSDRAEYWVMRIVSGGVSARDGKVVDRETGAVVQLVNGDFVEPIAEYGGDKAAAERAMAREAAAHPGERYKLVLNADPADLVGSGAI